MRLFITMLGAASAVTNGTVVRPARVVISAGDSGGHSAFMYAPVVETLRAGFLHATPHVRIQSAVGSSGASDSQWAAQQQLRRGDVYVHVGPWGHEMVPWHDLKRRGVVAVYYQTEPVANCYGALQNASPEPQEIWDFAWQNLDACARQLRRLGDNITLRYVPPGFIAAPVPEAAAWPAAPRLLFMGYPFYKSGRGRCYAMLQRALGERLNATWSLWSAATLDAWWAAEGQRAAHVHLHKHCGNGEQPPAVFRLSPLLSRGALVVSERCYERDEAEYAGLVHFAELNDIAGAFERVAKPPRPAAAVDALAAAFRSRFAPRRLFERAGVYELMRQTAAEASAPAPAAPPYAGRPGFCGTTPSAEGDCARGEMGSVALHALTRQRGMQQCAAFCRQCARCRFVSLSVRHRDCSWFYACDVQRLAGRHHSSRERNVWGFRTLSRDELLATALPPGLFDSLNGSEGRPRRSRRQRRHVRPI